MRGVLTNDEQWSLHNYLQSLPELASDYLAIIVEDLGGLVGGASSVEDPAILEISNSFALNASLINKYPENNWGLAVAHEIGHAAFELYHVNSSSDNDPIEGVDSDHSNFLYSHPTFTCRGNINSYQFTVIHEIR